MSDSPFKALSSTSLRRFDNRGYLDVLYEQGEVILKRSFSRAGVFRGMHWQRPPYAQTKIIHVVSGRILDFVIDPTQDLALLSRRELVPANGWIQIDAHLAHGFYAIEDTEFEYLCIGAYNESAESSFSILEFLKSELGLSELNLSDKDRAAKPLKVVDGGMHS